MDEELRRRKLAELNARMNPERQNQEVYTPPLIDVSAYYMSPNAEGSIDTRGGQVIQEPTQGISYSPYEDVTAYGGRLGLNYPVNEGILSGGITGEGYNVDVNAPGFQGNFQDQGITGGDISYSNDTGELGAQYLKTLNDEDALFIQGILNF